MTNNDIKPLTSPQYRVSVYRKYLFATTNYEGDAIATNDTNLILTASAFYDTPDAIAYATVIDVKKVRRTLRKLAIEGRIDYANGRVNHKTT